MGFIIDWRVLSSEVRQTTAWFIVATAEIEEVEEATFEEAKFFFSMPTNTIFFCLLLFGK